MFCIGSPEARQWPSVGKYKVDVASFESVSLPELKVGCFPINSTTTLLLVDVSTYCYILRALCFSSPFFPLLVRKIT